MRWQPSSCCLTVSTVSSFFVRLIAERIVRGVRVGLRWWRVVGWRSKGLWKWDLREIVMDEGGGRVVKRVASIVVWGRNGGVGLGLCMVCCYYLISCRSGVKRRRFKLLLSFFFSFFFFF
ncbi:hypothetical protein Hanom_Chr09g00798071 [Helianthus anomalus]